MNYELCKRAGLNITSCTYGYTELKEDVIRASEVEAMLQNAKMVYGQTEEIPGQVQWSRYLPSAEGIVPFGYKVNEP